MPFIPCPPLARFQFTPLREGRRLTPDEMGELTDYFNSRPSARGDAGRECRCTASILYFNSRPSARGDQADDMRARLYAISIHAPPRGATLLHRSPSFLPGNFNSRPSARGDCESERRSGSHSDFNSRPSARGDGAGKVIGECRIISIHAPPRGATRTTRRSLYADVFQFTPLREGRPSTGNPAVQCQYFNSRPSARGD